MIQKFYLDVIDHIHKNNVENKNFYWYGFITGDIEKTVDNDKRCDKNYRSKHKETIRHEEGKFFDNIQQFNR